MTLICAGAAVLISVSGFLLVSRDAAVVVLDESGEQTDRLPLPRSGEFGIQYRHSYYQAPATEHFVAEGGEFSLVGVSSPHGGVLDYYRLEGERKKLGERMMLNLDAKRGYDSLPLIATQRGRRTLVVGDERLPLYDKGVARHLTIDVERGWPEKLLSAVPGYP